MNIFYIVTPWDVTTYMWVNCEIQFILNSSTSLWWRGNVLANILAHAAAASSISVLKLSQSDMYVLFIEKELFTVCVKISSLVYTRQ